MIKLSFLQQLSWALTKSLGFLLFPHCSPSSSASEAIQSCCPVSLQKKSQGDAEQQFGGFDFELCSELFPCCINIGNRQRQSLDNKSFSPGSNKIKKQTNKKKVKTIPWLPLSYSCIWSARGVSKKQR